MDLEELMMELDHCLALKIMMLFTTKLDILSLKGSIYHIILQKSKLLLHMIIYL